MDKFDVIKMINKKNLIQDLENNIYCRLKQSPIHGIGVFAIRDIPKGTNPFIGFHDINYNVKISLEEIFSNSRITEEVKEMIKDLYVIKNGRIYFPNHGLNEIDISYFLNHSDDSNMEQIGERLDFFAKRDIKKGEELTVDYNTYTDI